MIYVGVADWMIPKQYAHEFPAQGSHLQRYASRYNAVEINSSFHTTHRPATYARWARAVPADFRFSVKLPREITHRRKLADSVEPLGAFLDAVTQLGDRLGPLLVQLPPSLAYDPQVAPAFFGQLRARFPGAIVFEPRHPSWFEPERTALLSEHQIARVAADPPLTPGADQPHGFSIPRYYRLHGSPDVYYTSYDETRLQQFAAVLRRAARDATDVWCIFDNTARQYATINALRLIALL